ncbi:mannitol-1-phosphate/altronate dehydrogenase [Penicillium cosmopolitanum]|uniref:Mannitol 2-dehydrogenase n=1 Tax=Penicillium cosmopolitanum TaxID=1131564 RepID=A0A9X0BEG0_9EURO|nr:mannitol-1-phosphate/altronate dehydrogenase [Penicillium cosmopolitanum]KAJ5414033.1 mannitol-1-phosphate/altronate dehydrogenase [Penicillium cosmopolitanum]
MGAVKLNSKNLAQIKAANPSIEIPTFKRGDAVKEGIVHVGVGGFHRAHLAVYINQLMEHHGLTDYAICGVGLQPFDAGMRDALNSQDCLYTVEERSATGSVAKVMGGINSYLFAPDDREAVIAKMAHPDTHIVSLTITESGYFYNENTHQLQVENPDIQHDLDTKNLPITTFGFLHHAMARRREQGLNPFTVMSCDNMQGNGAITRNMLTSFTRIIDPSLADWINTKGHFPNAMVDRITPSTAPADKVSLAEQFGIEDAWPIVTEPFMQWVIEDHFCDGRPPFEKVGVQIVKNVQNVEEFEKHKLRLLNGSHAIIAYGGQLAGYKYVHEVMENPLFAKFVWNQMQQEVKHTLPDIEGHDVNKYCETLIERFANPPIRDQLPRICGGGTGKIPQFIMPTIAEAIWVTGPFRRLCFTAATWFHYIHGVDDNGNKFEVQDAMLDELRALAKPGDPNGLLSIKNLFGDDLRGDKRFVETITIALEDIARDGVIKSLPKYID